MNTTAHYAHFTEVTYSLAQPKEEAIEFCRGELCAASYAVVQIGNSKLIGCRPGNAQRFVELTLQAEASAGTQVVFSCHATPTDKSAVNLE